MGTIANGNVSTLSYDMNKTEETDNVNCEIKKQLINKGWRDNIPLTEIYTNSRNIIYKSEKTPATTLWKEGVTPAKAIEEFKLSLDAYNINNFPKRPHGIAFAICNNEYEAYQQ